MGNAVSMKVDRVISIFPDVIILVKRHLVFPGQQNCDNFYSKWDITFKWNMSILFFFWQMILKIFFWIWRGFRWLSHKILLTDNPLLPKFYIFEMVSPINLLLQKHERQNTPINCTKKCLEGTGEKLEKYGIKKHSQT